MPTIKPKKERQLQNTTNIVNDNFERIRKEKEETQKAIKEIKNEIFEKSKANLPDILQDKVTRVVDEIKSVASEREEKYVYEKTKFGKKLDFIDYGLLEARIAPIIASRSSSAFVTASYSTDELFIIYNEFVKMISEINKSIKYLPTKKKFCSFAGMSSSTYNSYMQCSDEDKREVMQMIDDYITDVNLSSAQQGEVREITTMFRSKAEHNMVEANAPIVIEHKRELNLDEVKKRVEDLKQKKIIDAEFVEKE